MWKGQFLTSYSRFQEAFKVTTSHWGMSVQETVNSMMSSSEFAYLGRVALLQLILTWIYYFYVVLNMKEVWDIELIQVCWILKIVIEKNKYETSW